MPDAQPITPMLVQLPNTFGDAPNNMAIDAALLEALPENLALFRHYGWTEPAATFGYPQRYSDVQSTLGASNESAPFTRIVRRITGGGIVDHRNDWTYALLLQRNLTPARDAPAHLYRDVHESLQAALATMDIESQLAPCPKACHRPVPNAPGAAPAALSCFVQAAPNDVLLPDGHKVAGAAMKRTHNGLLIQGSISRATLPENFDFTALQTAFTNAISRQLALPIGALQDIRPLFNARRIATLQTQFQTDTWNQHR